MPKITKKTSTILIILAVAAAVVLIKLAVQSQAGLTGKMDARAKGSVKASIQITEFLDFQCPACAMGANTIKKYMEEHPDKLFVQLKYFPLRMHKHAYQAARYAECAARQDKFWVFHDKVFESQEEWKNLISADSKFRDIASEIELNMDSLNVCLQDETVNTKILEDKEEGRSLGVRSTPTYYVNNEMVVGYKELEKAIESLLK